MPEQKKINLGINDGNEFFAHEVSVNFNPMQFILDFKCITPRVDPRTKENPLLMIRHNIVMIDVFHARKIHEMLGEVIKKYEDQHGKIEIPKAIKKLEKKKPKENKKETVKTVPSYLG